LSLVLNEDAEALIDVTTNHTNDPIAVYHGIWLDTGNNAGWWLPKYFKIEEAENIMVKCPRCSFVFNVETTFYWTGVYHPDEEACYCPCCYVRTGGEEGYTFNDFELYQVEQGV